MNGRIRGGGDSVALNDVVSYLASLPGLLRLGLLLNWVFRGVAGWPKF